jgi:acyl carrier protein
MQSSAITSGVRTAQEILEWLVDWVAREARMDPASIDPEQQIVNFGLSSRQAVLLTGELEDWLGRPLATSLVWDYPTLSRMETHLAEK